LIPINEIDLILVDDNPNDVELVLRALKSFNLANKVQVAGDGKEALDFIFEIELNSDGKLLHPLKLILLDLKMPRVGGLEVLHALKMDPRTRDIPVVMLSSSQDPRDLESCYRLGASGYVTKPFNFEEFAKAVAEAGLSWLVVNKLAVQPSIARVETATA
jgi:two-component system response regulator